VQDIAQAGDMGLGSAHQEYYQVAVAYPVEPLEGAPGDPNYVPGAQDGGEGDEEGTQALESGAQLHEEANAENMATISDGVKDSRDEIQEPIENDFFDVMRLQSHFEDWDEDDNKDWDKQAQIVLALLERSGLTEIAVAQGSQELRTLTAQDVKQMISALESNAFGMFDRSKTKPICFGRGEERSCPDLPLYLKHCLVLN
jgi:hypothetical protein